VLLFILTTVRLILRRSGRTSSPRIHGAAARFRAGSLVGGSSFAKQVYRVRRRSTRSGILLEDRWFVVLLLRSALLRAKPKFQMHAKEVGHVVTQQIPRAVLLCQTERHVARRPNKVRCHETAAVPARIRSSFTHMVRLCLAAKRAQYLGAVTGKHKAS
jgi:hypothetical protein